MDQQFLENQKLKQLVEQLQHALKHYKEGYEDMFHIVKRQLDIILIERTIKQEETK